MTLTSKLSAHRPNAVQGVAAARGAGFATQPARSLWDLTTDSGMDAAHRGLAALAEPDDVHGAGGTGRAVQLAPDDASDGDRDTSGDGRAREDRRQATYGTTAAAATTGTDAGVPELAAYQGAAVAQPGKISAPAGQYEHARSTGVNVRARPDGGLPAIGKVRYDTAVYVQAEDTTGAFYFIVAPSAGISGWINRDFVALGMPDPAASLHHVTEANLTEILEAHYVAPGRWRLATGNDYTTLAAAVIAANQGRTGVRIDWQRYQAYRDEHVLSGLVDPWMKESFATYHASQVYTGHNIWLPSPAYVHMLQGASVIGTRPDWVNAAVDMGKGFAGFHAGVAAGVFGSLWDTLSGLWELGETVVGAISRAIDGSLFADLQALYDELSSLSWQQAKNMVASVVTMARNALGDFSAQWNHPDVYKQWFFRGRIAGAVALEVVLAIISGGGTLGAKVAAKIGQYAPRLARALGKLLQFADDLDITHRSGRTRAWRPRRGRGRRCARPRPARGSRP